jgi:hypothetical protein
MQAQYPDEWRPVLVPLDSLIYVVTIWSAEHHFQLGTPQAVILEQLEWFAAEVMTAFRGSGVALAPAD